MTSGSSPTCCRRCWSPCSRWPPSCCRPPAASASVQLSAFNDLMTQLVGNSLSSQAAVLADAQAFDVLQKDIAKHGSSSLTARQAFVSYMQQVTGSAGTLIQNKASVADVNSV